MKAVNLPFNEGFCSVECCPYLTMVCSVRACRQGWLEGSTISFLTAMTCCCHSHP